MNDKIREIELKYINKLKEINEKIENRRIRVLSDEYEKDKILTEFLKEIGYIELAEEL